jgi:hypothetical protein
MTSETAPSIFIHLLTYIGGSAMNPFAEMQVTPLYSRDGMQSVACQSIEDQ